MVDSDDKVSILLVDDRPDKLLALEAVLEGRALGVRDVRMWASSVEARVAMERERAVMGQYKIGM